MFKIHVLIVGILFHDNLYATSNNHIDSMLNIAAKTNKIEEKLNALYSLSFEYALIEPRKGLKYGHECLKLATEKNIIEFQLNAYNGIANAYETMSDFDSAKFFHEKTYDIACKLNDSLKIAITLSNIAACYKQLGEYNTALAKFIKSYKIIERHKNYNPRIHYYIGELYLQLKDCKNVLYHSYLGIHKCKEYHQEYVSYNMYINVAKCYQLNGQIDSSIIILKNILPELKKNTDKHSIAFCLKALGESYLLLNKNKFAYNVFIEEFETQKKLNNQIGICISKINMAYSLYKINLTPTNEIIQLLDEAEKQIYTINNNYDALMEIYFKLSETYELIGLYEKAMYYNKKYYILYNYLLDKEKTRQMSEIQTRYETEKKDYKIKNLEQANIIKTLQIKKNNLEIKARNIIIILILVLVIVTFFYITNKIKNQKFKDEIEKENIIRQTEEKERIRIARDIHDELGSGLSKIHFLSCNISNKATEQDEIKIVVNSIAETANNLTDSMKDLIWTLNSENTTLENLIARTREYSIDYLEEYGAEVNIHFPENVPDINLSKEFYRNILMSVKECLNNIVKHSKCKSVNIILNVSQKKFQFSIIDDGVGMDIDNVKLGNGLLNIQTRIQSIGGQVDIESIKKNGTSIKFTIQF